MAFRISVKHSRIRMVGRLLSVAALMVAGTLPAAVDAQVALPAAQDSAAVMARRQKSFADLRAILGNTSSPAATARYGPPFLLGYLSSFLGLQTRGRITVLDRSWEAWQQRTGELPPDFENMPSIPELPDPLLRVENGRTTRITSAAQWAKQREVMKEQFAHWMFGSMPPAPDNMRAVVLSTRKEGDVTVQDIRLEFGPDHRATLGLQLLIPPGPGPFPVFLTNHPRVRPWVNVATRRGYIGCIYFAADASYIGRDDSNAWMDVYPDADWSLLARWAWGAMRAVDYVMTLPNAEKNHIAISGHSRNSKQALIAAALDERIGAVVPSRGNAADALPFRYNTYHFISEPLEEITDGLPTYLHPRMRFFVGNEHKLPVDMNLLQALVAPRGLLLSHAYTEHQGNAFAIEQSYRSVKPVYELLRKAENLGLYQQPGEHPSSAEDVEVYFDFFDKVFGRSRRATPEMWVHGYTFDHWKSVSRERVDPMSHPARVPGDFLTLAPAPSDSASWDKRRGSITASLQWALGKEPPRTPFQNSGSGNAPSWWTSEGFLGQVLPRPSEGMTASSIAFGDALKGEFYPPKGKTLGRSAIASGEKWPIVIWLHPSSYATGYSRYAFWAPLVNAGFGVFAFDQIGFGSRSGHALEFYERYPNWSLLGKMVADTRAAIDAASALGIADTSRIYVAGFGLGAQVALVTAALDNRVKAIAIGAGVAPMRASAGKGTEGVRHFSHLHGLIPRFGFFDGYESRLPVDFDEVLALVAPRPVFWVAPTLDRYYPVDDIRRTVEQVNKVYGFFGRPAGVQLNTPLHFSRFPNDIQKPAYDWLIQQAGLTQPRPGSN